MQQNYSKTTSYTMNILLLFKVVFFNWIWKSYTSSHALYLFSCNVLWACLPSRRWLVNPLRVPGSSSESQSLQKQKMFILQEQMRFPLKVFCKNTLACLTEVLRGLHLIEKQGIEKQQLAILIPM